MNYTNHDYEEVVKNLNVPTVQSVFKKQQLVFMYKLLNGISDSSAFLGKN